MADQNTQNIPNKVCQNSSGACTDSFSQKNISTWVETLNTTQLLSIPRQHISPLPWKWNCACHGYMSTSCQAVCPVATEKFLFVPNMTVHVSFPNNSHHSITNNFQQLSSGNMWYGLANDQLTVTFSSWGEFNRRPLIEFPTGYIINSFWWCSSPSQIKRVAATWQWSTSLWLVNQRVLELLPLEIAENCCECPHA
jgi:hypothetical protein